jgi:group I intron endonuclease
MVFLVYKITCIPSGRSYIGFTSRTLKQRWRDHCKNRVNKGTFQYALAKYGREAFRIETIGRSSSATEAIELERRLIAEHRTLVPNGYNMTSGGEMHPGCKLSVETRTKIGDSSRGRKHDATSRAKMSAARKGIPKSPEHNAAVSRSKRGIKKSPEAVANMRIARKRRRIAERLADPRSDEEIAQDRAERKRKQSREGARRQRAKIAAGLKLRRRAPAKIISELRKVRDGGSVELLDGIISWAEGCE